MDNCTAFLEKNLEFDHIRGNCITKHILDSDKDDEIRAYRGNKNQMKEFLNFLVITDLLQTYPMFMQCLDELGGMEHVINHINEEEG